MEKITGPQLLRNSNLNTNIKFIKYKQNVKHKKLNDLTFDLVFHLLKYENVSKDGFCQQSINIYFILVLLSICFLNKFK